MILFLSRNKYSLLTAAAVIISVAILLLFLVPRATMVGDTLVSIRSEVKIAESVQGNIESPDSLIEEYNRVSQQIEKYLNNRVTSSKILTFIHGSAEKTKVLLRDLSTGESNHSSGNTEIPVSFRANASFAELHRFITELENGIYCIRLQDVNMEREENGHIAASIRLSVLSRGPVNE